MPLHGTCPSAHGQRKPVRSMESVHYTVGAHFGWRAMFVCGLSPVILAFVITARVKEPDRWRKTHDAARPVRPLQEIFSPVYPPRTTANTPPPTTPHPRPVYRAATTPTPAIM